MKIVIIFLIMLMPLMSRADNASLWAGYSEYSIPETCGKVYPNPMPNFNLVENCKYPHGWAMNLAYQFDRYAVTIGYGKGRGEYGRTWLDTWEEVNAVDDRTFDVQSANVDFTVSLYQEAIFNPYVLVGYGAMQYVEKGWRSEETFKGQDFRYGVGLQLNIGRHFGVNLRLAKTDPFEGAPVKDYQAVLTFIF